MNSFLFICKILVKVLVFISRQEMFNLPRSVYCMLTHPTSYIEAFAWASRFVNEEMQMKVNQPYIEVGFGGNE